MDYPKSDPTARLLNDKFTDGDPVNGVPASRDSADYQNMVFDEILSVIQLAGLTPDEGDLTQLWEAIMQMVLAEKVPEASSAEALDGSAVAKFMPPDLVHAAFKQFGLGEQKTSGEVDADQYLVPGFYVSPSSGHVNFPPDGNNVRAVILVIGGSNYVAQLVLQQASGRFFFRVGQGGAINGVAWLEVANTGNMAANLAVTGYQQLPSGLILQWGLAPSGSSVSVTFPVTFPNAVVSVTAGDLNDNGAGGETVAISNGGNGTTPSTSQFQLTKYVEGGSNSTHRVYWMALGY